MSNAEWYARQTPGVVVTEDHARCLDTLAAAWPLHNLPTWQPIVDGGVACERWGVSALIRGDAELATFDADMLTRLVAAAHRYCVRVALSVWSPSDDDTRRLRLIRHQAQLAADEFDVELPEDWKPQAMEIRLHARKGREGHLFERHPTIKQAIERIEARQ